jgi:hypothetical protein
MKHIVLLGDSTFDNAAYVNGGPDVIKQLRSILPQDWQATLLAVNGSVTTDVIDQIGKIPASATHLVRRKNPCPLGMVRKAVLLERESAHRFSLGRCPHNETKGKN